MFNAVNTAYTLNTKILSGMALEKALAAKLEELLRGGHQNYYHIRRNILTAGEIRRKLEA
jgi:hypothetical protein